jgi:hypothetical protein
MSGPGKLVGSGGATAGWTRAEAGKVAGAGPLCDRGVEADSDALECNMCGGGAATFLTAFPPPARSASRSASPMAFEEAFPLPTFAFPVEAF